MIDIRIRAFLSEPHAFTIFVLILRSSIKELLFTFNTSNKSVIFKMCFFKLYISLLFVHRACNPIV